MSVRSSGRLSASSNHCYASNIQYIGDPSPVASMARKKRSSADEEVSGASRSSPRKKRLYEANEKVYILKAYVKWREAGSSHWNSPMKELKKKYPTMGPNYPKSLYDKMLSIGTTANQWGDGRPVEYGEEVWNEMVDIIREHRANQEAPSGNVLRVGLLKVFNAKDVPSVSAINKQKTRMKFKVVLVEYRPVLTAGKMKERLLYCDVQLALYYNPGKWRGWKLTVIIDEKWFTEEKPVKAVVLKRKGSPMGAAKFKTKSKETRTQLVKLMYLCAISPTHGAIGYWRLNWDHHVRIDKRTGREVPAKCDSNLLKPLWKKIYQKAVIKFGQSHDIRLVLDKAPSHTSKASQKNIKDAGFDECVIQAATSPDFSHLDASIFPTLEKECNKAGASTASEIEAAVKKVWRSVTVDACRKATKRVVLNMEESAKLHGGNFYTEGHAS